MGKETFVRRNPQLADKLDLPKDAVFTFGTKNKKAIEVVTAGDASWDYSEESKPFFEGEASFIPKGKKKK